MFIVFKRNRQLKTHNIFFPRRHGIKTQRTSRFGVRFMDSDSHPRCVKSRTHLPAIAGFPLLPLLNATTKILCGYFIDNSITRPKSMLVVVFRIRNKGDRPLVLSLIDLPLGEFDEILPPRELRYISSRGGNI